MQIKKKNKTGIILVLMLLLAVVMSSSVVRADAAKGSITIQLNDIGTDMEDVEFNAYLVANETDENAYSWQSVAEFQGAGVQFNDLKTNADYRTAATTLAAYDGKKSVIPSVAKTDKTGKLIWNNLENGIYLVEQAKQNNYGAVVPFLVAIPTNDGNNGLLYDVTVSAKGEYTPTSTPTGKPTATVTPENVPGLRDGYYKNNQNDEETTSEETTSTENTAGSTGNSATDRSGSDGSSTKKAVKTGDETQTGSFVLLLAISAGAVFWTVRKRSKIQ